METVTIRINDAHGLKLLKELEAMHIIEFINNAEKIDKKQKLSERLSGSISSVDADIMRKELAENRSQWHRNI